MSLNPIFEPNQGLSKLEYKNLILHYFFLLFGFFGGNLFSFIFYIFPLPPIVLIIVLVLSFEITSCLYYRSFILQPPDRKVFLNLSTFFQSPGKKTKSPNLKKRKFFFLIKLGLLFGLFVDAFKVGS